MYLYILYNNFEPECMLVFTSRQKLIILINYFLVVFFRLKNVVQVNYI